MGYGVRQPNRRYQPVGPSPQRWNAAMHADFSSEPRKVPYRFVRGHVQSLPRRSCSSLLQRHRVPAGLWLCCGISGTRASPGALAS